MICGGGVGERECVEERKRARELEWVTFICVKVENLPLSSPGLVGFTNSGSSLVNLSVPFFFSFLSFFLCFLPSLVMPRGALQQTTTNTTGRKVTIRRTGVRTCCCVQLTADNVPPCMDFGFYFMFDEFLKHQNPKFSHKFHWSFSLSGMVGMNTTPTPSVCSVHPTHTQQNTLTAELVNKPLCLSINSRWLLSEVKQKEHTKQHPLIKIKFQMQNIISHTTHRNNSTPLFLGIPAHHSKCRRSAPTQLVRSICGYWLGYVILL